MESEQEHYCVVEVLEDRDRQSTVNVVVCDVLCVTELTSVY